MKNMKQLHIKFSDDEWKRLNDIYESRKNELEDAFMRKMTITGTIKDAINTSFLLYVDKNFYLMPKPKEDELPKESEKESTEEKAKIILKPKTIESSGGKMTFKPKATLKPAK